MAGRADLSGAEQIGDWAARGRYVYAALRETAVRSQAPLIASQQLGAVAGRISAFQPLWIVNAVVVHGDRQAWRRWRSSPASPGAAGGQGRTRFGSAYGSTCCAARRAGRAGCAGDGM